MNTNTFKVELDFILGLFLSLHCLYETDKMYKLAPTDDILVQYIYFKAKSFVFIMPPPQKKPPPL
jgi:hypothetical protein